MALWLLALWLLAAAAVAPHPHPSAAQDHDGGARGGCRLGYHTYGPGGAVATGEPVTFAAYGAAYGAAPALAPAASPAAAYQFSFHPAGAHDGRPARPSSVGTVTHTFRRAGQHVATVRCAPAEVANGSAMPLALWPLARVELEVTATAQRSCYVYRVAQPRSASRRRSDPPEAGSRSVFVSVWDTSEPTRARAALLTGQFVRMGVLGAPLVRISSMTKTGGADAVPVSGEPAAAATGMELAWQIAVPSAYDGPMDALLRVTLTPPEGLALQGCRIAPAAYHISRHRRLLPYTSLHVDGEVPVTGAAESQMAIDGSPPGTAAVATAHQSPCRPAELTIAVQRGASSQLSLILTNGLGHPQWGASASFSAARSSDDRFVPQMTHLAASRVSRIRSAGSVMSCLPNLRRATSAPSPSFMQCCRWWHLTARSYCFSRGKACCILWLLRQDSPLMVLGFTI